MRIKDLFVEADSDPLSTSLGDLTGWNRYQKKDTATADDDWNPDRVVKPTQAAKSQPSKSQTVKTQPKVEIDSNTQRTVLKKIIGNQLLLRDDQTKLQLLISNLQDGIIRPGVNASQLISAVKTKLAGYDLSKEQLEVIKQYSSTL
jgi:hypothetical protein